MLHLPRELHHDASAQLALPLGLLLLPDALFPLALGDHWLVSTTAQYIRLSHGLGSVDGPSFTCFSVSSHSRFFAFELILPVPHQASMEKQKPRP